MAARDHGQEKKAPLYFNGAFLHHFIVQAPAGPLLKRLSQSHQTGRWHDLTERILFGQPMGQIEEKMRMIRSRCTASGKPGRQHQQAAIWAAASHSMLRQKCASSNFRLDDHRHKQSPIPDKNQTVRHARWSK